jgi:hypothetical protein
MTQHSARPRNDTCIIAAGSYFKSMQVTCEMLNKDWNIVYITTLTAVPTTAADRLELQITQLIKHALLADENHCAQNLQIPVRRV